MRIAIRDTGSFPTRRSSDLLADGDRGRATGRFVIAVAVEAPVGRSAGDVGKAAAEVEQVTERLALDAGGGARRAMRIATIVPCTALYRSRGIGLADGDRGRASGRFVIAVAVEAPV